MIKILDLRFLCDTSMRARIAEMLQRHEIAPELKSSQNYHPILPNKVATVNKSIADKEREKERVESERSELEAALNNHDKIMWQFNDLG